MRLYMNGSKAFGFIGGSVIRLSLGALCLHSLSSLALAHGGGTGKDDVRFAFLQQPSAQGTAGEDLSRDPILIAVDGRGLPRISPLREISLRAYVDPSCSVPAPGTLHGKPSLLLSYLGIAAFGNVSQTAAGGMYLKISARGVGSACSSLVTIGAAQAYRLAMVGGDGQSAPAGSILPVPAQAKVVDAFGNGVSGIGLSFAPLAGGGSASPSVATSNAQGVASSTLSLGPTAGNHSWRVTRASGQLRGSPSTLVFNATAIGATVPATLALSGPSSLTAGACSAAFTVRTLNPGGQPINQPNALPVSFAGAGNGELYADSSCSSAVVSTVTVQAGSSSAQFYLRDARAETLSIVASAPGAVSSSAQLVAIAPAAAFRLAFAQAPSLDAVAGEALAAQPSLRVLDSFGNAVTAGSHSVVLSAASDEACQVPGLGVLSASANPVASASGLAAFEGVSYSAAGVFYLAARASGLEGACSPAIAVSAALPSRLVIVEGNHQSAPVGSSLSVQPQVRVTDDHGNPVEGAALSFSVSAGGGSLSRESALSDSNGLASVGLTLGQAPGANTLVIAGVPGGTVAWADPENRPVVTFSQTAVAGAPASLVLAGPVSGAAGSCAAPFEVSLRDGFGNPTVASASLEISLSGNGEGAFHADGACAEPPVASIAFAAGQASVSFGFRGQRAEHLLILAASGPLGGSVIPFTVQPAQATRIEIVQGDAQEAIPGATLPIDPSVRVTDEFGNPIAGETVSFAVSLGGGSVSSASVATDAEGVASARFTLGLSSGAQRLTASIASGASAQFAAMAVSREPVALALTGPGALVAGQCSAAYSLQLLDESQAPTTASSALGISLSGGSSGASFYADASCSQPIASLSMAAGQGAAQAYFRDTTAATALVSAQSPGLASSEVAVAISAASASRLGFSTLPSTSGVSGRALATQPSVRALDAFGNLATGFSSQVALAAFSDPACAVAAEGPLSADANPLAAASGQAPFAGVAYGAPGVIYLGASASGLSPVCSPAIVVSDVLTLAAGTAHSCALKEGNVKCWGFNNSGSLGNGSNTNASVPQQVVGLSSGVVAMGSGGLHACASIASGLVCWGFNASGQLGDGTQTNRNVPVAVSGIGTGVTQIVGGDNHTCVLADGGVRCWGDNAFGQLGNGTNTSSSVPVAVQGLPARARSIAAASTVSCAVLIDGSAYCWGFNNFGQLGDGTTQDRNLPVRVQGLGSVSTIAPGVEHACALVGDQVYCWGHNSFGQLGSGDLSDSLSPRLVPGLSGGATRLLSGGQNFNCAIIQGGAVQCWGQNTRGQLGDNRASGSMSTSPVQVVGLTSGMQILHAGYIHACASDGIGVKCWGWGSSGQLGHGSNAQSPVPVQVVGY
jgi:alpha-tubulin suppressor-like RCC1 family protein